MPKHPGLLLVVPFRVATFCPALWPPSPRPGDLRLGRKVSALLQAYIHTQGSMLSTHMHTQLYI